MNFREQNSTIYLHSTHDVDVSVEEPHELLEAPQAALAHAHYAPKRTGGV